jgi:hypothetical protein
MLTQTIGAEPALLDTYTPILLARCVLFRDIGRQLLALYELTLNLPWIVCVGVRHGHTLHACYRTFLVPLASVSQYLEKQYG